MSSRRPRSSHNSARSCAIGPSAGTSGICRNVLSAESLAQSRNAASAARAWLARSNGVPRKQCLCCQNRSTDSGSPWQWRPAFEAEKSAQQRRGARQDSVHEDKTKIQIGAKRLHGRQEQPRFVERVGLQGRRRQVFPCSDVFGQGKSIVRHNDRKSVVCLRTGLRRRRGGNCGGHWRVRAFSQGRQVSTGMLLNTRSLPGSGQPKRDSVQTWKTHDGARNGTRFARGLRSKRRGSGDNACAAGVGPAVPFFAASRPAVDSGQSILISRGSINFFRWTDRPVRLGPSGHDSPSYHWFEEQLCGPKSPCKT